MTKAERDWMDAIARLGCIVCLLFHNTRTPAEVHHLLTAGRIRRGHLHSIPLCKNHHRSGRYDDECVSRHPWRKRFIDRYGTEQELLEKTRELVRANA